MAIASYIQKMIDEFNATHTPEIVAEKEQIESEVVNMLACLILPPDLVFKEFSINPIYSKPTEELAMKVEKFSNQFNQDCNLANAGKMLIVHLNDFLIYRNFCDIENVLRHQNIKFEEIFTYQSILIDLVDDVYKIKKLTNISTSQLLTCAFCLAIKDYYVTMFYPLKDYISNIKSKKHEIKFEKDNLHQIVKLQKKFILQDELLANQYKNFVYMYKNHLFNLKFRKNALQKI